MTLKKREFTPESGSVDTYDSVKKAEKITYNAESAVKRCFMNMQAGSHR